MPSVLLRSNIGVFDLIVKLQHTKDFNHISIIYADKSAYAINLPVSHPSLLF